MSDCQQNQTVTTPFDMSNDMKNDVSIDVGNSTPIDMKSDVKKDMGDDVKNDVKNALTSEQLSKIVHEGRADDLLQNVRLGHAVVMTFRQYSNALTYAQQAISLKNENSVMIDALYCLLQAFKPMLSEREKITKIITAFAGKKDIGMMDLLPHAGSIMAIFKKGIDPEWMSKVPVSDLFTIMQKHNLELDGYSEFADSIKKTIEPNA